MHPFFSVAPSKHSSWWRRLEDVLKMFFVFVFRRRLQDVLIKTNMFALALRFKKTSCWRLIYSSWPYIFKTSSKRFQDVFKTSSRHFENVFKTYSRRFQDVLSSQSVLGNTISRHLRDVFKTFLRCTAKTIIYRRFA